VCERESEWERVSVCVCERESEWERVSECVWEREWVCVWVSVSVWVSECVCVVHVSLYAHMRPYCKVLLYWITCKALLIKWLCDLFSVHITRTGSQTLIFWFLYFSRFFRPEMAINNSRLPLISVLLLQN